MKKLLIFLILFSFSFVGFSSNYVLSEPEDSSMVYDFPENMAQFPGGADAMDTFIRENLNYPEAMKSAGVQGRVYVQFIVEKDGSISNVKIRRSSNSTELDQAAIDMIKLMPNWVPGSVRGKEVRVKYTLPVAFNL